jgi:hypothetical protein
MEVEANDTLPFLEVLVMKRGPKLTTKENRKPTQIARCLYFKSKHLYHVKRGVIHILMSQAKDGKDFNNEIKNN